MALAAKLFLRQSQSLVMTPQLMQSIRLLQFTHAELERFIETEIERNPLLERGAEFDAGVGGEAAGEHDIPDDADAADTRRVTSAEAIAERLDSSLENLFPDDPGRAEHLSPELSMQWRSLPERAGGDFDMDDFAARRVTLREHVDEQIAFSFADPARRIIARELADGLDEAGYLRIGVEEVADRLGAEPAIVEDVLETCRGFDPVGLFARDLADCLSLQLAARGRLDPAMAAMLANLDLLARRDFQALRGLCGVEAEDLVEMLDEIRLLDPKPGAAFGGGVADTIVPDVTVRQGADGGWAVELNPATLPKVLVDRTYFAEISARTADSAEREFLAECLQNANWLTRSLDQRARTILKVAGEIVRQQDAFLAHGVRHLRPLNLRMVADAIGMHESTVSRVTANKYMETPRGVFELRYFFTGAIAAADGGEAHSSEAVRDRIRALIGAERPEKVLSDDAIVAILAGDGVEIARRTVAKYREGMNIPSSVERRREKRALAAAGR